MRKLVLASLLLGFAPLTLNADTFTSNLLSNAGAESGTLAGWTSGGTGTPQVDNGSFDPGINPHTGSYDFVAGYASSIDTLSQTVSVLTQGVTTTQINSGLVTADLSFWEQSLNQGTPSDEAGVTLYFLGAGSTVLGSDFSGYSYSLGSWENITDSYVLPDGTVSIEYQMNFFRNVGSDLDAFVDDNSLILDTATVATSATPEPSSLLLLATGLMGCATFVRNRAKFKPN